MVIDDLYTFEELVKACGNRYLATMFISESARRLGHIKKEYHISESKLIQWVLTGQCPYTDRQLERMKESISDDGLSSMLCWVTDKDVAESVKRLYSESIQRRRLRECADSTMPQGKIDRINILLRMIWYSTTI